MKQSITEESIGTMIGFVANQNYADATTIIQDLLNQRVVSALDEYKQSVAQNLFAPSMELSEEKDDDKKEDEKDDKKEDDKDEDKKDDDKDDDGDDDEDDKDDEKK